MNEGLRQKLIHGGGWVIAGRGASLVLSVASNALLARLLIPANLGAYFLVLTMTSTAASLFGLGLQSAVVRFTAEALGQDDPGRARRAIMLSLSWGALAAAVASSVLASGAGALIARRLFHSDVLAAVMPFAAAWLFVFAMQNLVAEVFRGLHDIRLATVFGGLAVAALNVAAFAFLRMQPRGVSLQTVVIAITIAGAAALAVALLTLGRKLTRSAPRIPFTSADLLAASIPLWISAATVSIVTQADLWIVGAFRPASGVALYGAASRLALWLSMPLMLVNAVIPPVIGDMYARRQKEKLEEVLQGTAAAAAIPAFVLVLVLALFGRQILAVIFGPVYAAAAPILLLLSLGHLVNILSGSCGVTLVMTGHQRSMMVFSLVSAAVMIGLALVLVRDWGEEGVAFASTCSLIVQNAAMWWWAKSRVGVKTHGSLRALLALLRG